MRIAEPSNMRPPGSNMEVGLKAFVSTLPVNCFLAEVGCFAGHGTRIFLTRASKVLCVDPWSDYVESNEGGATYHMIGMDKIEQWFDQEFAPEIAMGRVIKLKMVSVEAASTVRRVFDVVYLDGNHQLDNILQDIVAWLPKVKPGGVISGHDYDRQSVKQAVSQLLGGPDSVFADFTWKKQL